MDLSNPIRSVIPAAHGEVLAVLARTEEPMSGRRVADLTDGRVSQKGVNLVLRALVAGGLATAEDHPPAKLYRLNRRHLAANSVAALATLREQMIDAMRSQLETWTIPAWGAWLFGSAARGGGDATSDIDVLIVRPDDVDEADAEWLDQLEHLVTDVAAWTGNSCEIVEYAAGEFEALMSREDRLAADLRSDGVALTARRQRADRLARELAELTGESLTDVVEESLEARLELERRRRRVMSLADIVERFGELPLLDERSEDEILGYGADGLPQ